MKYIKLFLVVPDWVHYTAIDQKGRLLGFEKKPFASDEEGWVSLQGNCVVLGKLEALTKPWKDSLETV